VKKNGKPKKIGSAEDLKKEAALPNYLIKQYKDGINDRV
jgi:hypothetical protein